MGNVDAKKQILVADGDSHFVKVLVHLLEEHGFDALTASSFQGALQKAQSLDVDLILLGGDLPDAACPDVCQRLKSNKRTEHIPIVLMTRNCQSQYRIKCYHLGADDCVARDLEQEELFVRMEAVWRRFNGQMKSRHEERKSLVVQELVRIIECGLIEPYFQPIYFMKPFRLLGLEVLSRPGGNTFLSDPEELFRCAIKYDMYAPLEMLCWEKAIDVVSSMTKNENLFLNCSPHLIENSELSSIKDVFDRRHIPLSNVVLEITERSSVTEYRSFCDRLNEYRGQGFSFAVDDVGGGYASLESIVATKPEVVKIDAHIVRNIQADAVKKSIVKFIVAFCRENKIVSVGEGVETREEFDTLAELGVDSVQGYYLFRPTPCLNLHEIKDVCVAFS